MKAQRKLRRMVKTESFDNWMYAASLDSSLRTRTTSAASIAKCAPAPIAMPTSAAASAGASLTPSPTTQTEPCPASFAFSSSTFSALCFGSASACTRSSGMPTSLAMACAVFRPSPVHIQTSKPRSFWRCRIVRFASARRASRMASAPRSRTLRSMTAWTMTTESRDSLFSAAHTSSCFKLSSSARSWRSSLRLSSKKAKLPMRTSTPWMVALTPRPTL
mmetsp:Transcript_32626/g.90871  ORF Transcript_32626/g.90871 Transcript_32626/m.90871 type:complete len:219 (-) Transcript_32626:251-907(-)